MNPDLEPLFRNPFRPGAGHMPPYLAGRKREELAFRRLLDQDIIFENLILTGLRGVGKTVLLDALKPVAIQHGWLWVGTDLSESTSVSERSLAIRVLADLAPITSTIVIGAEQQLSMGFSGEEAITQARLGHTQLAAIYDAEPGLSSDKLKAVLTTVWSHLAAQGKRGIIFAYDEAQNLSDHSEKDEYPLSVLLDVFQSIQKKGIPFFLVLTGLPTLFPKLVEARTYSERMFHILFLSQLSNEESRDAILKPIEDSSCPVKFGESAVDLICRYSGGYPYFIQFMCREAYDAWSQKAESGTPPRVPIEEIVTKLDTDFFSGRWHRATDRQRDLLTVIASLEHSDTEFTVQEIVSAARRSKAKPFSSSHVNQMLASLSKAGLVYKNRHGRYAFAVPLLGQFVRRQNEKQSGYGS